MPMELPPSTMELEGQSAQQDIFALVLAAMLPEPAQKQSLGIALKTSHQAWPAGRGDQALPSRRPMRCKWCAFFCSKRWAVGVRR